MERFINEDTYEGQIDNPLSLNRYTYVHNNPLKYVDPSGHKPVIWYDKEKKNILIRLQFSEISKKEIEQDQSKIGIVTGLTTIDILGEISSSKVKNAFGKTASIVGTVFTAVDVAAYAFESDISWLVQDLVAPGLMYSNRKEQITLWYVFAATLLNKMVLMKKRGIIRRKEWNS